MKIIIAGSRTISSMMIMETAIKLANFNITAVISGCAKGVDSYAITWAEQNGIHVYKFPAQWDTYGKKAGYLRNIRMAECAEGLIAIWDGKSKGTEHMINIAKSKNLPTFIYTP